MMPCEREKDFIRLEETVMRHDRQILEILTSGAKTEVYMKQVLDSQSDMKTSLKEIQDKLNSPPPAAPPTPLSQDTQMSFLQRMLPQLLDLLKWAIIIIGALVGAESLLK